MILNDLVGSFVAGVAMVGLITHRRQAKLATPLVMTTLLEGTIVLASLSLRVPRALPLTNMLVFW